MQSDTAEKYWRGKTALEMCHGNSPYIIRLIRFGASLPPPTSAAHRAWLTACLRWVNHQRGRKNVAPNQTWVWKRTIWMAWCVWIFFFFFNFRKPVNIFTPAACANILTDIDYFSFVSLSSLFPNGLFNRSLKMLFKTKGRSAYRAKCLDYSWEWRTQWRKKKTTKKKPNQNNHNDFEFTSVQGNLNSDSILGGGTIEVQLRIWHIPLGHNCFAQAHTWRVRLLMQPRWKVQNNEEETA